MTNIIGIVLLLSVILFSLLATSLLSRITVVTTCSQNRLDNHRTSIELALEASLPPSDSSSTSSSDDSTDGKAHGVDLDTLAVRSLILLLLLQWPAVPDCTYCLMWFTSLACSSGSVVIALL